MRLRAEKYLDDDIGSSIEVEQEQVLGKSGLVRSMEFKHVYCHLDFIIF